MYTLVTVASDTTNLLIKLQAVYRVDLLLFANFTVRFRMSITYQNSRINFLAARRPIINDELGVHHIQLNEQHLSPARRRTEWDDVAGEREWSC